MSVACRSLVRRRSSGYLEHEVLLAIGMVVMVLLGVFVIYPEVKSLYAAGRTMDTLQHLRHIPHLPWDTGTVMVPPGGYEERTLVRGRPQSPWGAPLQAHLSPSQLTLHRRPIGHRSTPVVYEVISEQQGLEVR